MREILFRGKRVEDGKWLYGYYSDEKAEDTDFPCIVPLEPDPDYNWEVDPETVGQYTGLKDKNGKKIFEGDILSGHLDELFPEHESRYPVVWHEYGWHIKCDNGSFDTLEQWWVSEYLEVIGNVYDNPELMGGNTHG